MIDSPFVVKLRFCFQDRKNIYLVMDYYSGGDLFALVEKQPYNRLPESSAKYYVNQCKAGDNRVACRDCNGLA